MQPHKVRKDVEELNKIVFWLDGWRDRGRDPVKPSPPAQAGNVTPLRDPRYHSR